MLTQHDKAVRFAALHRQQQGFIIPNPWDIGSARLLESLEFSALATTSAGYAFSQGKPDNSIGREETMLHLAAIVAATELPVSADLVNGFGDDPDTVAQTIRMAAATGIVGGSIEDASGSPEAPIYAHALAVERIRAASDAAKSLAFPFILTARAENHILGRPDLHDTIRRLQDYQEAGADVLFAPGLTEKHEIAAVLSSVDRPLNVMMGLPKSCLGFAELSDMGVKRVSVGGSLYRAAFGAFMRSAEELRHGGTFGYAARAVASSKLNELFK
jgi:2-methylisocitrate lyase-like PEP mutase family enzyme